MTLTFKKNQDGNTSRVLKLESEQCSLKVSQQKDLQVTKYSYYSVLNMQTHTSRHAHKHRKKPTGLSRSTGTFTLHSGLHIDEKRRNKTGTLPIHLTCNERKSPSIREGKQLSSDSI